MIYQDMALVNILIHAVLRRTFLFPKCKLHKLLLFCQTFCFYMDDSQETEGIRQRPIYWCTSPMTLQKISLLYSTIEVLNQQIKIQLKSPKMLSQHFDKTLLFR